MAENGEKKPLVSRGFLWRFALLALLLAIALLGAKLWLSGGAETKEAFLSGRRLLITLATGEIQGKRVVSPEAQAAPLPAAPAETPPPAASENAIPNSGELLQSFNDLPPSAPAGESAAASPAAETPAPAAEAVPPAAAPPDTTLKPAAESLTSVNPALTEKSKLGPLPIIGPDGSKPWMVYSKHFKRKGNQPMIAIIVTGLGQNRGVTENALKLPEAVDLSFSPYARDVASWGATARISGHEVLLDLPLQPSDYPATDPGPYGLLTDRTQEENKQRLAWLMTRLPGAIGFVTPQNESFSGTDSFAPLLEGLAQRGLLLVVGREPPKSRTKAILETSSAANIIASLLIDEELSPVSINARLTSLELIAKKNGSAVGIAQAYPLTVEQLRLWADKLAEKGIVLVPVSAIIKLRYS